jgi:hypothetical protein
MHINHNESVDSDLLLFGKRLSHKLYKVIELLGGELEVFSDAVGSDSLFD